jgi:tetratricopeptide (TPR) repeat protein
LLALDRADDALSHYRRIVERKPDFTFGRHGLALAARKIGLREEALDHFRVVAERQPDNVWASQDVGTELLALGRLDEAAVHFRAAIAKNIYFSYAWHGLGQIARKRGDHADALRHFRIAAALEPEKLETLQDIATELRGLGRAGEADELLKSAIERHPSSAQSLFAYAEGLRNRAPANEIIALLRQAVALDPGHALARKALADACFWNGLLDEADTHFDALAARPEWKTTALIGKGLAARRRGKRAQALAWFEAAASGPPPSDWADLELSRELFETGEIAAAERLLDASLARNPHFVPFYLRRAANARAMGDSAAARDALAKAAAIEPDNAQVRVEAAREEFFRGKPDLAISLLEAEIARRPQNTGALEALADLCQRIDDQVRAVDLRQKALEADPSGLWAHIQLAHSYTTIGRFDDALALLATGEATLGPSPEIDSARLTILLGRGERLAAREVLEGALARYPAHFDLWRRRVSLLTSAGAFAEARRAVAQPPEFNLREMAKVAGLQGLIAEAERKLDEAYEAHLHALTLDPADPDAHEAAARVALLRLDTIGAKRHIDLSVRHNLTQRGRRRGQLKASQTFIGQLLDEYRIDARALADLQFNVNAEDRLAALALQIRAKPDYTPAAICLFMALSEEGRLGEAKPPSANGPIPSAIPARIVQYWDQDMPADVEALCQTWADLNPGLAYRRFSKVEARAYLRDAASPETLTAFERAREPAMKADIFRLAVLAHEGGWYADADDRCLAPFADLAGQGHDLVVAREDVGTLGNNFIGATPGHAAIKAALDEAVEAVNRGDSDIPWLRTGPALLTRAVAVWLSENLSERLPTLRVLERHELFERVAIHCAASYKHTKRNWFHAVFPGLGKGPSRSGSARNRRPAPVG